MEGQTPELSKEVPRPEIPEDVAALFAWANLPGARYRDFSAARRESRARQRQRTAQSKAEAELRAKAEAERAAAQAEAEARAAGEVARFHEAHARRALGEVLDQELARQREARLRALQRAQELHLRAEQERVEAARRAAAMQAAEEAARNAGSEAAEAHASEQRRAELYSRLGDPERGTAEEVAGAAPGEQSMQPERFPTRRELRNVAKPTQGEQGSTLPAWIDEQAQGAAAELTPLVGEGSSVDTTLQQTRERMASRWYALRGVFDPETPEMEPTHPRNQPSGSRMVALYSLAGGVGKTSLAASLGRSLSALGERVLLADLTPQSLLPFYFGATETRPGVVRTFSPPPGSADMPISVISYDLAVRSERSSSRDEQLAEDLAARRKGDGYLVLDVSPAEVALLRGLLRLDAMVLVPVTPDMNSVISLGATERFFEQMRETVGRPVQPHYLLTQFDASLPLHLDVREGLREKLGSRLLPFAIRRSSAVAEALADGMTVIDYSPQTGVASDYRSLAAWVRTASGPAQPETRSARWSEQ